jgi:hypothetical protein
MRKSSGQVQVLFLSCLVGAAHFVIKPMKDSSSMQPWIRRSRCSSVWYCSSVDLWLMGCRRNLCATEYRVEDDTTFCNQGFKVRQQVARWCRQGAEPGTGRWDTTSSSNLSQKDTYSMMSISMARSRMHEPNLASLSFLVDSIFLEDLLLREQGGERLMANHWREMKLWKHTCVLVSSLVCAMRPICNFMDFVWFMDASEKSCAPTESANL